MPGDKFEVALVTVFGNSNIGVYITASDKYVLMPEGVDSEVVDLARQVLGVEPVIGLIGQSRLLGVLAAGNSNGLLVGSTVREDELQAIKEALPDINVSVVPSRNNAIGNLVAANDRAALVYPDFDSESIRIIRDTLDVEVVKRPIAGITTVGSVLVVTNRGGLVHPDAGEDEISFLQDLFKVPILTGTVNFGMSFVRTGLVANSRGALAGGETTGPELARIQMALSGGEVG